MYSSKLFFPGKAGTRFDERCYNKGFSAATNFVSGLLGAYHTILFLLFPFYLLVKASEPLVHKLS